MKKLLDGIKAPADLRKMSRRDLPKLAGEIREKIIDVVSETGGHLASSLGAVELTIAAHYVLDTPRDKIIWDVGHQAYTHKILTGRKEVFKTLRQLGGLSGFPNKYESEYDVFTVGHSSTSISGALGLAAARDLRGTNEKIIAVIGDAALGGGMAFEAMNHAGHLKKDIIVILNDNELSISKSVGALSRYLNDILVNPLYNKIHGDLERLVKRIPKLGPRAHKAAKKFEEGIKNLLVPGTFFEKLGFRYFGPIDGHSIDELIHKLRRIVKLNGPILLHAITKKGKGYKFSEAAPLDFHGSGPFNKVSGKKTREDGQKETFTFAFSEKIIELAEKDERIAAVSAAMVYGTGLAGFAAKFPKRTFDVGIAEQHAITFAAALARGGLKPFAAIYSTFLQRAYDQIIHDVCLQDAGVVFCIDRAGLVGEDGATHNGIFDISYLRHLPNIIVTAPKNGEELKSMMEFAVTTGKPFSIRYPRGGQLFGLDGNMPASKIELGKSEVLKEGRHVVILALGSMVSVSLKAAELLSKTGIQAMIVNARFVKPLDGELIENLSRSFKKFVTVEEGAAGGGFGSAVLEFIGRENIKGVELKIIGLPDEFIEHGKREQLMRKYNLTPEGIAGVIAGELFDKQLTLT
ncbi:MAG: 1-deoxy-D-xylulose-5-phosphate synthase [Candidatus Omnitrophota bacterium]|nr:1-deoxy-D-xylulose-5-phosphate synthase [Candidatus Omnitrophota bacterium]